VAKKQQSRSKAASGPRREPKSRSAVEPTSYPDPTTTREALAQGSRSPIPMGVFLSKLSPWFQPWVTERLREAGFPYEFIPTALDDYRKLGRFCGLSESEIDSMTPHQLFTCALHYAEKFRADESRRLATEKVASRGKNNAGRKRNVHKYPDEVAKELLRLWDDRADKETYSHIANKYKISDAGKHCSETYPHIKVTAAYVKNAVDTQRKRNEQDKVS
jgi:hypothetical protein